MNENTMNTESNDKPDASPGLTLRRRLDVIPLGERGLNPTNIDELFRLAQAISLSKICPPGFSETDCFVVIATGLEIGLAPFTAIQNMYIVNNRASIFGDIALGLIRARGVLEDYKQEYFGTPFEDSYGCRVKSKRKGMAEPITTEYTVADARRTGKWNLYHTAKNGEKIASPWVTDPNRMLLFRARGFNLRDNFGDILKGVGVDTEDEEIKAGFEHARIAQGRIVAPNFAEAPKPAASLSASEESPRVSAGDGKPAETPAPSEPAKRPRGRSPRDKTDLFDKPAPKPQELAPEPAAEASPTPAPEPSPAPEPELSPMAKAIKAKLKEAKLDLADFLELMASNGYLEGSGKDLVSVLPEGLEAALQQWPKVVEHLTAIKNEHERPFA